MTHGSPALLATIRDPDSSPEDVRVALVALLAVDPVLGTAAAFDLLAGEPRIKPSSGLVIDPGDGVRRRWACRVAAGAALSSSPAAAGVADELADELAESPELARDVAAVQAT